MAENTTPTGMIESPDRQHGQVAGQKADRRDKKLNISKEKACVFMDITLAQYDAYVKINQKAKK